MNIINAFPNYIKILSGKTIILYFCDDNTVNDIKKKIKEEEKIPVEEQNLTYLKNQLFDDKRLKDCRIQKNSTLYLSRLIKNKKDLYINEEKEIERLKIQNKELNKKIKILETELNEEKNKNKKLIENNIQSSNYGENEKDLISVIFISKDETFIILLIVKKNEQFLKVSKSLYKNFPELSKIDNEFFIDGKIIEKNKTLMENDISDNSMIVIK